MARIKLEGLTELQNKLKKNVKMDDVRKVVRKNGADMANKMIRNADFKGHYEWESGKGKVFKKPTGTTKRSINLDITDGGMTALAEPTTEYSPYLEHGTRFMNAQPFVKPAFDEQKEKFKKDMSKLTK